ncbi:integrase [Janthinobacterium sp. PAMC25594]|uniref:integrase n=1 Tax=Janthinobacterium sp. PAMC25594 TaxID=2861284 RepID=UPI001C629D65|nr:integrase [Janthinobacterium sp. PAMC25594]QYG06811.1 integrase [Janthinobacterium sp. PAMC25594]
MRTKKTYAEALSSPNVVQLHSVEGRSWMIQARGAVIDFRRWKYVDQPQVDLEGNPIGVVVHADRNDLVELVKEAVWDLKQDGATDSTILNFCRSGIRHWFIFLDELLLKQKPIVTPRQITTTHINHYIDWLRRRPSRLSGTQIRYTSVKAIYSATKSVLMQLVRMGRVAPDIFPLNPFPNVKRAYHGQQALSKAEMEQVVGCLGADLLDIRSGSFEGNPEDRLIIYFMLIAIRSGRNTTPLLEMTLDSLHPHPLRDDMMILELYKRRGFKKHTMAFRFGELNGVSTSVPSNVTLLINEVIAFTSIFRESAAPDIRSRLWLLPSKGKTDVTLLNNATLAISIHRFVNRHTLVADLSRPDGTSMPIVLNVSRFRKTFGQRMWDLSGGNLLRTADLLGNLPRITDSHYLAVTPEMERNHKFLGLVLHATLDGTVESTDFTETFAKQMKVPIERAVQILHGDANTGVGRCTDHMHGRFSPRNGRDVCTRFLHCFRCPNQVVMESDLHRLFSFYWLLLKERRILGRTRWKNVYSWVIREIDNSIVPNFPHSTVAREKERARTSPHPMWRDRSMLGMAVDQ